MWLSFLQSVQSQVTKPNPSSFYVVHARQNQSGHNSACSCLYVQYSDDGPGPTIWCSVNLNFNFNRSEETVLELRSEVSLKCVSGCVGVCGQLEKCMRLPVCMRMNNELDVFIHAAESSNTLHPAN